MKYYKLPEHLCTWSAALVRSLSTDNNTPYIEPANQMMYSIVVQYITNNTISTLIMYFIWFKLLGK